MKKCVLEQKDIWSAAQSLQRRMMYRGLQINLQDDIFLLLLSHRKVSMFQFWLQ